MKVDYSLYLVTDSTKAILGDRDIILLVQAAVEGGVTIVQYRDKTSDTGNLINVARELHKITKEHGIPLLINDRVDVALAVGAEGVHIGQDDMDLATARRLLGKDAIIGVTASSAEEALQAANAGADYLGIGTVFATPTKQDTKSIIGIPGLRHIVTTLSTTHAALPTVCIGGINSTNLQRVLFQSNTPSKRLDGIAVVSAIMASTTPRDTASTLRRLIHDPPPFAIYHPTPTTTLTQAPNQLISAISPLVRTLAAQRPLCHNMTNTVVQNLCANICLAIGGSPIMSTNGAEARDLARLHGSLVINMGTATPDSMANYILALTAYNAEGCPVVLDPVGCGATAIRRANVETLLAAGYFDVMKGNEAEIRTVLNQEGEVKQHGVDSSSSGGTALSETQKACIVKTLAKRERNVVLMTGRTDFLSDGTRTYAIDNGHEYLGKMTGSGCALGTVIAAFAAAERASSKSNEGKGKAENQEDMLQAVLAGTLLYEIAAEAAGHEFVRGPGSFVPAFVDELYRLRVDCCERDFWGSYKARGVKKASMKFQNQLLAVDVFMLLGDGDGAGGAGAGSGNLDVRLRRCGEGVHNL